MARESSKTDADALTAKEAKAEHARLEAELRKHDEAYYQHDAPTVSDAEYDELRRRYGAIEERFPELVKEVQRVMPVPKINEILQRLEKGELALEDSLAVFERGIALVRQLSQRLVEVEQRVELLLKSDAGKLLLRPMPENAD